MEIIHTVSALKESIKHHRQNSSSVGFVPTMGALHEGHISLVRQAASKNSFVVVSIFVNPTQFNDKEDLKKYPRDLNSDIKLLEGTGCNLVFAPKADEVYPETDNRVFEFGDLGAVMEGEHRPGHFNGVAQVVSKLFDMVMPDRAYFGKKDFQQLAIIKNMVKQLNLPIEIIPCDIVRETDGLAMSSRNVRLTTKERESALAISKTLFDAIKQSKNKSVSEVKKWVIETINNTPYLKIEYFDIVDDNTLATLSDWEETRNKTGCIAVMCGNVRLIDNVSFS